MSSKDLSQDTPILSQDQEVIPPNTSLKTRRIWTATEKLKVLEEIDLLKAQKGDLGAYLRRRGIYKSLIYKWNYQRSKGQLVARTLKSRGPEPKYTQDQINNSRLMRENEKLKRELDRAKKLIEIQKKISLIMEDIP